MLKVTNTTSGMMMANRHKAHKDTVLIQRRRKDGTWGKAMEAQRFGHETDEQVVERLVKNNNCEFRIAQ